jgi:hypothetical protein
MRFAKNYYQWLIEEVSPFLVDYVAEIGAGQGNFSSYLLNTGIKKPYRCQNCLPKKESCPVKAVICLIVKI